MIEVACQQQTPEWYELRRGVLTASHFGQIITPKTRKMSAQVVTVVDRILAEWLSGAVEEPPSTRLMERGIILEPDARRWYEWETGTTVRQVGFCFLDNTRRVGCSPDGLVGDDGGVEIKCLGGGTHIEALLQREVPPEFLPQIQGSLWITGRKWWDYVSYHDRMPSIRLRVLPDKEYIAAIAEAAEVVLETIRAGKMRLQSLGYKPLDPASVPAPNPADYGAQEVPDASA